MRSAADATLLIDDLPIASGNYTVASSAWMTAVSCAVGAVHLGEVAANPFLVADDFSELLVRGQALLAEMALKDRQPIWGVAMTSNCDVPVDPIRRKIDAWR